jgi:hypothetical protein
LSLPFVACNKKDNSVSSLPVLQQPGNVLLPGNLLKFDLERIPKANIAPNPTGLNLLSKPEITYYSGPGVSSVSNILDGDPSTICWSISILVKWPYSVEISRLFAATPQIKQDIRILPRWPDDKDSVFLLGLNKDIDFKFPSPICTDRLMLIIDPNTQGNTYGNVGISELEIYGPAEDSLKILSPSSNLQFNTGEKITLIGTSTIDPTYWHYYNFAWYSNLDGYLGKTFPSISLSNLQPGTHTITLALGGQISVTGSSIGAVRAVLSHNISPDSIVLGVKGGDIAEIRIKNLDNQDFASYAEVSYRAAQTQFQAIGYREDGSEIGPVSVRWELEGGEVDAHDQLRMGILSHLGQLNTRIGNLDSSRISVASATTVTFNSFLPGNLLIKASRGDITDSVYVRIKQPHFSVNVYPVGDVDTSIFNAWKDIALQIWEKENIIKVDSIDLMPTIANVSYPNYPLTPPLSETEAIHLKNRYFFDLSNPLVYDCMLGDQSGFFNVPRQSRLLMAEGEIAPVNVFMVQESWCYYVADIWTNPPKKVWREPFIYSISSRDNFVTLENSCSIIKTPTPPYLERQKRYLAAGIGRNFGLPQYANWLNNFMDFSDNGAFDVTPLQYITALNYNNDNPQNSIKIWEE